MIFIVVAFCQLCWQKATTKELFSGARGPRSPRWRVSQQYHVYSLGERTTNDGRRTAPTLQAFIVHRSSFIVRQCKEETMQHYSYLIVGGGMTAAAAAKGIREIDAHDGTIGIISTELQPPYKRPPLSKGLWKTTPPPLAKTAINLQDLDVQLILGRDAQVLDTTHQRVTDDRGDVYSFDKLLLATGGVPRRLADSSPNVIYYRTLADFQQLHALAERGQRFAVIGGGFIGSEIAAALAMNQKHVTMLFPGSGIGAAIFAPDLSQFLNDYYRQRG